MQAYLGDAKLKADLVREIARHRRLDHLVKGTYGEVQGKVWKGCAIGCALESLNRLKGLHEPTGDHTRFPTELGIPIELAYLIDHLFEALEGEASHAWPGKVATAITPGAELGGVMPALLQWMILDGEWGWITLAEGEAERTAFRDFAALVARDWGGDSVTPEEWQAIEDRLARAWAGAGAGARAWARARAGAWAGARAWARARAGARAGANEALAAETLRLLKVAPVVETSASTQHYIDTGRR